MTFIHSNVVLLRMVSFDPEQLGKVKEAFTINYLFIKLLPSIIVHPKMYALMNGVIDNSHPDKLIKRSLW